MTSLDLGVRLTDILLQNIQTHGPNILFKIDRIIRNPQFIDPATLRHLYSPQVAVRQTLFRLVSVTAIARKDTITSRHALLF